MSKIAMTKYSQLSVAKKSYRKPNIIMMKKIISIINPIRINAEFSASNPTNVNKSITMIAIIMNRK